MSNIDFNIVNKGRCPCPICRQVYLLPNFTRQPLKLHITHCLFFDVFIVTFVSLTMFVYYKMISWLLFVLHNNITYF